MASIDRKDFLHDEYLFTPRNSAIFQKSSHRSDDEQGIFTEKVSRRIYDDHRPVVTPNQSTIKRIQRAKDSSFIKNIKNDLVSLKTEVNKLIQNNNEQKLYQQAPHQRSRQRSTNQDTFSQISLDSHQTQSLWKRMKNQIESETDFSNSTPIAITERRLKFFEEENQLLKIKIKKMRGRHKEERGELEGMVRGLRGKLEEAEEMIVGMEEEMAQYRREVEEEMIGIKKMLQVSTEVLKRKSSSSELSIFQHSQYKKLLDKTLTLKQKLYQSQQAIVTLTQDHQLLLKENSQHKLQIDHLNNHITLLANSPNFNNNTSLLKSGESKINLDYSNSRVSIKDKERQDERSLMFDLSDCLERKESIEGRREGEIKRLLQSVQIENEQLYKQIRGITQDLDAKNQQICILNKQNQLLNNTITLLQNQLQQKLLSDKTNPVTCQKDQYIKQLQDKITSLELKSSQISQVSTQPSSNFTSTIQEKDMEITYLRQQLREKSEEVDNLRDSLGTLHKEFRESRGEVEGRTAKFVIEVKGLREELESTRSTLKGEIGVLQNINEELREKLRGGRREAGEYQFEFQGRGR